MNLTLPTFLNFGASRSKASPSMPTLAERLPASEILWLSITYLLVLAPHAQRLPVYLWLSASAVMVWRLLIAFRAWPMPPRWLIAILTVTAVGGTWFAFRKLYGRDGGTALLCMMVVLKLLEMRARRDVLIAIYLGFFVVTTNFFYSQSVLMALYMVACIAAFIASLIAFNRMGTPISMRGRLKTAGFVMLLAAPLAVALFLFFPRASGPLWRMPDDQRNARIGLSDRMTTSTLSSLIQDGSTAFIARFESATPASSSLYWRGPVLTDFDGNTWLRADSYGQGVPFGPSSYTLNSPRNPVTYTLTMEPSPQPWVFALDMFAELPPRTRHTWEYQLLMIPDPEAANNDRRNIKLTSYLNYSLPEPLGERGLERNLRLPKDKRFNPKTLALGRQWRAELGEQPQAIINRALQLYNKEFTYTLEPPPVQPDTAYDDFLFLTKQGFCEHYSGSFVTLMRAAGLPARVVTGFLGGELNPYDNTMIVKNADAHAWTEVWLGEKRGWVRIDPTSAVAPDRIERGVGAIGNPNTLSAFESRDPLGLVAGTRLLWSAFDNRWNQWVINFNGDRQTDLLSQLGLNGRDWVQLIQVLVIACLSAGGLAVLFLLYQMRPKQRDRVQEAYLSLCKKLVARGAPAKLAHEGPQDYLTRLLALSPALGAAAKPLIEHYISLRYRFAAGQSVAKAHPELVAFKRAVSGL